MRLRFIFIRSMIILCLMQSALATKITLHNLLKTTPSSSHIIDYRRQRRTDSRADKPDTFPGFDFHEDSTTPSPRKRRRQAYSQLIRLFIQNTRDRLDTIRDVIKNESELHFHVTQPLGESVNDPVHFANGNDDSANRQFIDLAFTDASMSNDDPANIARFTNKNMENISRTYLDSLFAAVGYRRITTTPSPAEIVEGSIITRYVLSPIFRLWLKTREQFNFHSGDSDENDTHENDADEFDVNFPNDANNSSDMQSNNENETNHNTNEYRVQNFNYSLPFSMIQSLNNETSIFLNPSDVHESESIGAANQNADERYIFNDNEPHSVEEAAATAFQKAFSKQTNDMEQIKQKLISQSNDLGQSTQFGQLDKNENNELLSEDLLIGRLFDRNSTNIQVVKSKKSKLDRINFDDEDGGFKRVAGIETNKKSFGENAGILVLEIIGTVVGSTWKALSQIPNYLMGQRHNHMV